MAIGFSPLRLLGHQRHYPFIPSRSTGIGVTLCSRDKSPLLALADDPDALLPLA